MLIRELAQEIPISTASFIRFCKKVGFDGFGEFKTELKLSNQQKYKTKDRTLEYLLDYFHKVDNKEFEKEMKKAAKLLMNCDELIFWYRYLWRVSKSWCVYV